METPPVTPAIFTFALDCPYSYLAWEALKCCLKSAATFPELVPMGSPAACQEGSLTLPGFADERWEKLQAQAAEMKVPLARPVSPSPLPQWYLREFLALPALPGDRRKGFLNAVFRGRFVDSVEMHDIQAFLSYCSAQGKPHEPLSSVSADSGALSLPADLPDSGFPRLAYGDEEISGLITPFHLERFLERVCLQE
jgi:2-hydroxychromene-2-carboxylate isomerase